MTTSRRCIAAVTVAVIGLLGTAQAAQPLSREEVVSLVTGSKVTQRGDDPKAAGQLLQYDAGGKVTRTFLDAYHRGFQETGTWEVRPDGQMCITWQGTTEARCFYFVPTGRGTYKLPQDPTKTGMMEVIGVSK
jgi:hypothetical protein